MATFDYADLIETADELLTEFGREDLVLRSFSQSGDAWNPSRTSSDTTVLGIIIDYDDSKIDGSLILATDRRALISPNAAVTPTTDMRLVEDGQEYEIVRINTVKPAGSAIIYDLQVRR